MSVQERPHTLSGNSCSMRHTERPIQILRQQELKTMFLYEEMQYHLCLGLLQVIIHQILLGDHLKILVKTLLYLEWFLGIYQSCQFIVEKCQPLQSLQLYIRNFLLYSFSMCSLSFLASTSLLNLRLSWHLFSFFITLITLNTVVRRLIWHYLKPHTNHYTIVT